MKSYEKRQIAMHGHNVEVDVEDVANEVAAVKVTARVGAVVVEHVHTLGPVDGGLNPPSAEQVQASLDSVRDTVARKAAHRATLLEHLKNAK